MREKNVNIYQYNSIVGNTDQYVFILYLHAGEAPRGSSVPWGKAL